MAGFPVYKPFLIYKHTSLINSLIITSRNHVKTCIVIAWFSVVTYCLHTYCLILKKKSFWTATTTMLKYMFTKGQIIQEKQFWSPCISMSKCKFFCSCCYCRWAQAGEKKSIFEEMLHESPVRLQQVANKWQAKWEKWSVVHHIYRHK